MGSALAPPGLVCPAVHDGVSAAYLDPDITVSLVLAGLVSGIVDCHCKPSLTFALPVLLIPNVIAAITSISNAMVSVKISHILEDAGKNAKTAVNLSMVYAYFEIDRMIVEEEQTGENRAEYGAYLLKEAVCVFDGPIWQRILC